MNNMKVTVSGKIKEYKDGTEIVSGLSKNDLIIENCDDIYNGQKIKMNEAKNNA